MNILDIICAAIIAYMLFRGLYRGILIEVFSLAGLVAGFILAKQYYAILAPYLARGIAADWAAIISFMVIFMLTIALFTMTARGLKKILTLAFVGWTDHLFGGLMGLFKGLLIACVILALITTFMPDAPFLQQSLMAPKLHQLSEFLRQFLPIHTV